MLDVPSGSSMTLDAMAFSSTASFRGIKYLKPGLHLFTYGLDKSELGMRTGFFFKAKPGDVLALKWDKNTEQLVRLEERVEGHALEERLLSLHPYLTTFRSESEDIQTSWTDLTSHITPDILNRILPASWTFTSQTPSTSDASADQLSNLPSSRSEEKLNFTPVDPKRTFNPNAIGRDRTDQILDKSYYLESLLQNLPDELSILGELQLSFLTVLYMNNFSGFETWKNIFTIFCGCSSALRPRERLFREFLTVSRQQFEVCSEETFNEVILEGNFVAENLRVSDWNFTTNIEALNAAIEEMDPKSATLEFSFAQLTALLNAKFSWNPGYRATGKQGGGVDENDWDREVGEYAPEVVDLESDEDIMDEDINFGERTTLAGHMDMKTGKMVFSSR